MKYEIYQDKRGEWRWRFKARNGKILAMSSEGYKDHRDCRYSLMAINGSVTLPVIEL